MAGKCARRRGSRARAPRTRRYPFRRRLRDAGRRRQPAEADRLVGMSRRSSNMVANCGASAPNPELKNSPISMFGASASVFSSCGSARAALRIGHRAGGQVDRIDRRAKRGKIGLTRSRVAASSGGTSRPARTHWSVPSTPLPPPNVVTRRACRAAIVLAAARRAAETHPAALRSRRRGSPRIRGRSRRKRDRRRRACRCVRARPCRSCAVSAAFENHDRFATALRLGQRVDESVRIGKALRIGGDHARSVVLHQRENEVADRERRLVAAADRDTKAMAKLLRAAVRRHGGAAALADHRDRARRQGVDLGHQRAERSGEADRRC